MSFKKASATSVSPKYVQSQCPTIKCNLSILNASVVKTKCNLNVLNPEEKYKKMSKDEKEKGKKRRRRKRKKETEKNREER